MGLNERDTKMNRHDTQHSEACRIARYAARARAAGDIASARRYEQRALELVGHVPAAAVTEWRPRVAKLAAVVGALVCFALPSVASAEGKARKPVICMNYELVQTKAGEERGAVCYDAKRPKYLVVVGEMVIRDPEAAGPVKIVVGF